MSAAAIAPTAAAKATHGPAGTSVTDSTITIAVVPAAEFNAPVSNATAAPPPDVRCSDGAMTAKSTGNADKEPASTGPTSGVRGRRRLGAGVWRWIAPERLRLRGRTVAFDLDKGEQGQVRLFSTRAAELSRRYGLWVITDRRGGVWMRTAGSTLRLQAFVGEKEFPGEEFPGEPDEPDSKPVGWMGPTVSSLSVLLIEFGLLWLALDGPVQAFREQPATVLVLALLTADIMYGIPAMVKASRWREPEQWHEVPISVTGIGFRRPWSSRYTVRGTGTLPTGTTVPVQVPDTQMDMVASISATGKLWVADPPTPSSKSITGLPDSPTRSPVWFGKP